jgi:UDP-N-acetylmuramyl pentapeptide phosphotransferase/UDP-N-acetylglucosamine-1-phosphate transferase
MTARRRPAHRGTSRRRRRGAWASCIVGVADDLWDLDWMIKLGAQFVAAGIVVGLGGIQIFFIPLGAQIVVSRR